jgi:hypothetical protein
MKKLLLGLSPGVLTFALFVVFTHSAEAYVSVKGYYRSNGTYVQPYVRSSPNALKYDNYSYKGGSLYNNSYSNPSRSYSPSWYSPSYVTDPNYYSGFNLYRSRF